MKTDVKKCEIWGGDLVSEKRTRMRDEKKRLTQARPTSRQTDRPTDKTIFRQTDRQRCSPDEIKNLKCLETIDRQAIQRRYPIVRQIQISNFGHVAKEGI